MSGMPSVVNEKRPFIASSILASRRAGTSAWASAHPGAKSCSVNGSTEGITSASSTPTMSRASIGSGSCP